MPAGIRAGSPDAGASVWNIAAPTTIVATIARDRAEPRGRCLHLCRQPRALSPPEAVTIDQGANHRLTGASRTLTETGYGGSSVARSGSRRGTSVRHVATLDGDAGPARHLGLPPDGRPAARHRRACRVAPRRESRADAPRRHGHREDGDDGLGDGGAPAPRARDRAQQDAGRPALQRVPGVLSGERGRVLRLLLRLLPARGLRPSGRPLHREGLLAERRHRAPSARRDELLLTRRDVVVVASRELHLRARLAGGVAREGADPRGRRRARPRRDAPHADRLAVRPQRHGARAGPFPRAGRRRRGAAGERRDGVPHLDVRRRGRADLALRPAHRRGALEARQPRDLAGDGVHHLEADRRPCGRRDQARARAQVSAFERRAGCSRRTGSASAPSTTWRC